MKTELLSYLILIELCSLSVLPLPISINIEKRQGGPRRSQNGMIRTAQQPTEEEALNLKEYQWLTLDGQPTALFAHRGEKVLLPEHTLPGYETASILGADFVEPDLCLTKDNYFVCHHDLVLRDLTDVADHPEFDHLKKNMSDGTLNWYIRDFTLTELKSLKIRQENLGIRPLDYNLFFSIPTFQEYLNVIHRMTLSLNRTIGIVPELKNPSFHNANQSTPFLMEKLLLQVLSSYGYPVNEAVDEESCEGEVGGQIYPIKCPPVIIQCFELPSLQYLSGETDLDLLLLVEEDTTMLTYKGLEEASKVAKYYAVWKEYLYVGVEADLTYNNHTWDPEVIASMGGFVPAHEFPIVAHELGMRMIIYTIHDSREKSTRGCAIVPGCEPEDKVKELGYFFGMGVDGIFIENVAESRDILKKFQCDQDKSMQSTHSGSSLGRQNSQQNVLTYVSCMVSGYMCADQREVYQIEK